MYERTHNYYVAVFTTVFVLAGGILGSFIPLLSLGQISSGIVTGVVVLAVVLLLTTLFILATRIRHLHR